MKRLLLCTVLVVGMAGPAAGQAQTGEELHKHCLEADFKTRTEVTRTSALFDGMCIGYIQGVSDVLFSRGDVCASSGANIRQKTDIVQTYFEANPKDRQLLAVDLVTKALSQAFPCKN